MPAKGLFQVKKIWREEGEEMEEGDEKGTLLMLIFHHNRSHLVRQARRH